MSLEEEVDVLILYLRKVHGFCYYSAKKYEDERNLSVRCGDICVRDKESLGPRKEGAFPGEERLEKQHDLKIADFLASEIVLQPKEPDFERMKEFEQEFCAKNTRMRREDRFECLICNKLFKADHFVHNHILNKHKEELEAEIMKEQADSVKFVNYVNDKNKIYEKFKIAFSAEDFFSCMKSQDNQARKPFKKREIKFEDVSNYKDFDAVEENKANVVDYDDL